MIASFPTQKWCDVNTPDQPITADQGCCVQTPSGGFSMVAHAHGSRPFPRGCTAKGEEMVILTWRDLEFFSQVHVHGDSYRTYCPIHNSDQERSLSIHAKTGFGHCFSCE